MADCTGKIIIKCKNYPFKLGESLYELQKSGQFCELYLRTDAGEDWPVHSCVAVSSSTFISSVLNSIDVSNNGANCGFAIPLEQITNETLSKVTQFMYTGQVELFSAQQLQNLNLAAEYLQMPGLIQACCENKILFQPIPRTSDLEDVDYEGLENVKMESNLKNTDESIDEAADMNQLQQDIKPNTSSQDISKVNCNLNDLIVNFSTENSDQQTVFSVLESGKESDSCSITESDTNIQHSEISTNKQSTKNENVEIDSIKEDTTSDTNTQITSADITMQNTEHLSEAETQQNIKNDALLNDASCFTYEDEVEKPQNLLEDKSVNKIKRKIDPKVLQFLKVGKKKRLKSKQSFKKKRMHKDFSVKNFQDNDDSLMKFECGECGKQLSKKGDLVKHMNFIHPIVDDEGNEKDLQVIKMDKCDLNMADNKCFKCPREFKNKSSWLQHLNFAHRIKIETSESSTDYNDEAKQDANIMMKSNEKNNEEMSTGVTVLYRKDVPPQTFLSLEERLEKLEKPVIHRERVDKDCPECGKFFRFKIQYDDHVLKHTDATPYRCTVCDAAFKSKKTLEIHMLHLHEIGEKKFSCSKCGKLVASRSLLEKHELIHTERDRTHVCDLCGKSFMQKTTLKMHIKFVHKKTTEKCLVCGKKVAESRLKEHMNLHTGDVIYPCHICSAVYKQKKSLECHLKFKHSIGVDPEEKRDCHICHQHFANSVTLERHMRRHSKNKPYKCDKCSAGFFAKAELKMHLVSHLKPEDRPFCCPVCLKTFNKEYGLKSHMLIHDATKPLSCNYCGKGFRWKNKLKEHMRTHTGEKPFKCRHCSMRFAECATRRYHEKKKHPFLVIKQEVKTQEAAFQIGNGQVIISQDLAEAGDLIIDNSNLNKHLEKKFYVSNSTPMSQPMKLLSTSDLQYRNLNTVSDSSQISGQYFSIEDDKGNITQYLIESEDLVKLSTIKKNLSDIKIINTVSVPELKADSNVKDASLFVSPLESTVVGSNSLNSFISNNSTASKVDFPSLTGSSSDSYMFNMSRSGLNVANDSDSDDNERLIVSSGSLQDTHMVIASEAGVKLAMIEESGTDKDVGEGLKGEGDLVQYVLQGEEGEQVEYILKQGQATKL